MASSRNWSRGRSRGSASKKSQTHKEAQADNELLKGEITALGAAETSEAMGLQDSAGYRSDRSVNGFAGADAASSSKASSTSFGLSVDNAQSSERDSVNEFKGSSNTNISKEESGSESTSTSTSEISYLLNEVVTVSPLVKLEVSGLLDALVDVRSDLKEGISKQDAVNSFVNNAELKFNEEDKLKLADSLQTALDSSDSRNANHFVYTAMSSEYFRSDEYEQAADAWRLQQETEQKAESARRGAAPESPVDLPEFLKGISISSTTSDQTSYTEQSTYTAPDGTVITESYQSRTMTDSERSEAMSDAAAQISKGLAAAEATHSAMSEHSSVNQFSNSSTTSDQTSYTEQSTYTAPDGTVTTESYQSRTMSNAERSEALTDAAAQISQGLATAEATHSAMSEHSSVNQFSNSSTTSDQTSYTEQSTYTAPDGTVITESYQSRTMTDAERSEAMADAAAQISQGLASAEAAQAILTDINEFHGEAGGIRDTAVGGSTSTSNGSSVSESSTGYESEAGAMQVGEVAKSMEEFKAMFPELDKSMTVADFAEAVSPETAQRLEAEGVSKDFVSGMISQVNDVIPGEHAATDAEVFTFNAVNTAWGEQGGSYEDVVDFANKELSAVLENTSAFVQSDPDADVDMESESEAELGAE